MIKVGHKIAKENINSGSVCIGDDSEETYFLRLHCDTNFAQIVVANARLANNNYS